MTNFAKLTAGLLGAWFAFSLSASALRLFVGKPDQPPIALLLAFLGPVAIFLTWYRTSDSFRSYILGLNPKTLTLLHTWRVVGYTFLVLYTYHILPGLFALPAGWGDITIGVTAAFVASRLTNPEHRASFILWQILGITDLVVAIGLGALSAQRESVAGSSTVFPMATLPLSLIPTFFVPLLLIVHLISIAQARRWATTPALKAASSFAA
jgi:uncharacterized membrane protein YeaQ/YmgE (transglycosylase-associated protein family)